MAALVGYPSVSTTSRTRPRSATRSWRPAFRRIGSPSIGRLRGRAPKLSPKIEAHLVAEHDAGNYTVAELATEFKVARSTVYRAVQRAQLKDARTVEVALALPPAEESL